MLAHTVLAIRNEISVPLPVGVATLLAVMAGVAFWAASTFFGGMLEGLGDRSAGGLVVHLARVRSLCGGRVRRYRRAVELNMATHPLGFDDSETIDIRSVYVPLHHECDGRREDVYTQIRRQKRSVVTGAAGAGKSLLLKNSMLIWAAGNGRAGGKGQIPVMVELHRCNADDGGIEQLVVDELARNQVRRGARAFVDNALHEGRLRLLLDGLDEVGRHQQERVARMIRDFARTYPTCQLVVTCRDTAYYGQLSPEFSHIVRVAEFDDVSVHRLLGRWPGLQRTDVDRLLATLRGNPPLMRLARSPLLLTMIAYLYVHKFARTGRALPASRASFYETAIFHLLGRDRELGRSGSLSTYEVSDKLAAAQRIAVTLQEGTNDTDDPLTITRAHAISVVRNVLPDINLDDSNAIPLLDEIVNRSQLLIAQDRGRTRYVFRHLTLQEYLAARELADEPDRLLQCYRRDPAAWREVVKLWCGGGIRDCTGVIREVMRSTEPLDRVLALECVADARQINDDYAAAVIDQFLALLGRRLPERQAIISAFGAVAAAPGPRGRKVLAALVETADSANANSGQRQAALHALAASGQTDAAEALIPLAAADQEAQVALRAMGDLAVPALTKRARAGDLHALDDLAMIATPAAADALTALLWEHGPAATRAAWWLAELLVNPDVEDGLRQSAVTIRPGARTLDWIWRPFGAKGTSTLPPIAGRVGYLLDTSPEDAIPDSTGNLDVRIALPIVGLAIAERTSGASAVKADAFLPGLGALVRAVGRDEGIEVKGEFDWAKVDEVCRAAGCHQAPSPNAVALTEAIVSRLHMDKRYVHLIERLDWPTRANLAGAAGDKHMGRVSSRDWVRVNRHPRPATVLWALHISLWTLTLLGATGIALYEQVLDVRGEFSSGLLAKVSDGLRGSAHHRWFTVMAHPWGSWISLIGCGFIVAAFVIFWTDRLLGDYLFIKIALIIIGFLGIIGFALYLTWLTLLALLGKVLFEVTLGAVIAALIATAMWADERTHQVANPLRRCLIAGRQSLRDRVSVIAE
ncbi:MAG TPA: NACHT domain-containing protein [Streptosporangiaceae bacterium]|nr:NACHT domain-containing protein [Streptosporangiaceae bacterium]